MTGTPPLPEKVVALVHALESGDVPFAVGGALALAYYGEPRATVDIDINIFMSPDDVERVGALLQPLGIGLTSTDQRLARRDGQIRLWWDDTAVDLFFAYDEFHFHAAGRIRLVPFRDMTIPILAAEDLMVCKVVFDRPKDWIDIDQMLILTAGELDINDVRRWVTRIVGPEDPRLAHLEQRIEMVLGAGGGASER